MLGVRCKEKHDLQRVGIVLWRFPFKSFVLFFVSLNVTLFVLHRFILFADHYHVESQNSKEHSHVFEHICRNATLRAGLGPNYIDICHSAETLAMRFVWLAALKRTIQDTHLCGDVACMELLERFLEIVTRSLAFTACAVLVGVLATLVSVIYCCAGRRSRSQRRFTSVDLEEAHMDEPKTILDFNEPYTKTPKKYV